jgi:hypothetical protein
MFDVKPIPVPIGFNHPDTPGNILPRHEFSMGIIGIFIITKRLKGAVKQR